MTGIKPQNSTDRCRLTLTGEIDLANAGDYLPVARAVITECKAEPCFTIDLSGVTFIDSTGLAMLVGIRKATTDAGMELRLAGTPRRVRQLLEITGLDGPVWTHRRPVLAGGLGFATHRFGGRHGADVHWWPPDAPRRSASGSQRPHVERGRGV